MFNSPDVSSTAALKPKGNTVALVLKILLGVAFAAIGALVLCGWLAWHMISKVVNPAHSNATAAKIGLAHLPADYQLRFATKLPSKAGEQYMAMISKRGSSVGTANALTVLIQSTDIPATPNAVGRRCRIVPSIHALQASGLAVQTVVCGAGEQQSHFSKTTFVAAAHRYELSAFGPTQTGEMRDLETIARLLRSHPIQE